MIQDPFSIWVYWQNREEGAGICAARLAEMLSSLAAINPAFSHWYRKANSLKNAFKLFCEMPPQVDELGAVVQRGQFKKEDPPDPWPELGYSVSAWNGIEDDRGLSFRAHVGAYNDNRLFPNIVEINIHPLGSKNGDLVNGPTLKAALVATVDAWEGAWACVASSRYTKRIYAGKSFARGEPAPPAFRSGWMTYLSAPFARRIVAPVGGIVEPMKGGALLMRATDDVFDFDNAEHLEAADAIQRALEPLQFDPRNFDARQRALPYK